MGPKSAVTGSAQSASLSGKVVLVTGATRGFGLALSRELAGRGATLLLASRSIGRGRMLAREMQLNGWRARAIELDLTNTRSIGSIAERVQRKTGHIDVLVNNAGIFYALRDKYILATTPKVFTDLFSTNTLGPALLTIQLQPMIRQRESGQVVFVSSEDSSPATGGHTHVAYAMSKAALNMAMLGFARQLVLRGIRVFGYAPGWMKTDMGGPNGREDPSEQAFHLANLIGNQSAQAGAIYHNSRPVQWWDTDTPRFPIEASD